MFLVDTYPGVISSASFQECLVLWMSYSETLTLTHNDAWYDVKNQQLTSKSTSPHRLQTP